MATWYYVENDARIGPVAEDEMNRLIGTGAIAPDTLVWKDGMGDWAAASTQFTMPAQPPGVPPAAPGAAPATAGTGTTGADGLYAGAPARGFGEAISECFSKYVGFSGRASRSEYWYFMLFSFLLGIATSLIDLALFGPYNQLSPVNSLTSLALFLPTLAVSFRRLHDTNRSGWWIGGFYLGIFVAAVIGGFAVAASPYSDGPLMFVGLLALVAVGYAIMLIVFLCQKGDLTSNQYG